MDKQEFLAELGQLLDKPHDIKTTYALSYYNGDDNTIPEGVLTCSSKKERIAEEKEKAGYGTVVRIITIRIID